MKKRIRSFSYAIQGISEAIASEPNLRIHLYISVLVIAAGFLFRISAIEWIACFICIGMVVGAELINSSIEKVVDLASPHLNSTAGKAKDMAAGAVLICAICSVVVGAIIFLPKIIDAVVPLLK